MPQATTTSLQTPVCKDVVGRKFKKCHMTQEKEIKIIFWGTPEFAIAPLEALISHKFNLVTVVTNPDEPVGRKQALTVALDQSHSTNSPSHE